MKVVIVGASIAGLAAGLALQRRGIAFEIIERTAGDPVDHGAGLGLDSSLLRATLDAAAAAAVPRMRLWGHALHQRHQRSSELITQRSRTDHAVSTWQQLHAALRTAVRAPVRYGICAERVLKSAGAWSVQDTQGHLHSGDCLVGADGHDSIMRRAVTTQIAPQDMPKYAGYFLWRGLVEAPALDAALRDAFFDGHLHVFAQHPYHFVTYEVPAARPDGPRRLNWGWYAAVPEREHARIVAAAGLPAGASIIPAQRLSAVDLQHWVDTARRVWPRVWSGLVELTAAAGGLFANAIHERAPEALARGRLVLVGDAAHLLSPITGSGARLALADALSLEAALAECRPHAAGLPAAIQQYSLRHGEVGRRLLASARAWAHDALGAAPTAVQPGAAARDVATSFKPSQDRPKSFKPHAPGQR